jgi:glycosyltransferase involved in cell wall biosynthesis
MAAPAARSLEAPAPAAPPRVSVVLPTHDRATFLPRAIASLLAQELRDWELRIVDDGSGDGTEAVLRPYLEDPRIHLRRLPANRGLGAALNAGLEDAQASRIAYLPSDDLYHDAHLGALVDALDREPGAVLAWAGVRHHYNREAIEPLPDDGLQLVQLLHRRVPGFRWLERDELVTDSLAWMGLDELARRGRFVATGRVTCEWVAHPGQLHRLLREPVGGIAPYRRRYRVAEPLRFHSTTGDRIDEVARYARYRSTPVDASDEGTAAARATNGGLRILLAGELAYNADRILAFEEAGHRLFGLWMPNPYWYNTVGPLPFGHVEDAASDDPAAAIRETRPDVIYALLNWQAVPFAASVLRANPGVPFVWHFKEGPFISLEQGHWSDLVELVRGADGLVYSSEEMRAWFATAVPGADDADRTLVLDGDLPKADWLEGAFPARLSAVDGEIRTVVPGRPIGLHPGDVSALAAGHPPALLRRLHPGPVARVDRAEPGAGPTPPPPPPHRRAGALGRGAGAVRRRLAPRLREPERRRHSAGGLGRPQRPRAAVDAGRRRAADAATSQPGPRRRRGTDRHGRPPRPRVRRLGRPRRPAPGSRVRRRRPGWRARGAGVVHVRCARRPAHGVLRARHRPAAPAGCMSRRGLRA